MRFKRLLLAITVLFNFLLVGFTQEPTLLDHGGGVRTVAFSPVDASLLASAGESNIIKLWDLQNDTVQTLSGHTAVVNSIAFSPNGELLASVSDDRTIRLWNVHNQQNIATLRPGPLFRAVAFSPDGQLLATGGWIEVKLWDVRRRTEIATLQHDQQVRTVAFSSDGQLLAAGYGTGEGSGTVKVWNVKSRQVVATLEDDLAFVRSVTFSSDDRYLASSHYNGEVKVWNVSDWELLRTMPAGDYDIAFSPDGKMIAGTGNGSVNLWWVEGGTKVAQLPGPTDWMHPVDFSHDGVLLAVGAEDRFVRLYNIEDVEKDIEARLQALQQPRVVRLIYFRPQDRAARPDRVIALRQLIKDTQKFFADQMEHHGFARKTFRVETDETGEVLVRHIVSEFNDQYYHKQPSLEDWNEIVWDKIREQFYTPQHVYLVAIDVDHQLIEWCGGGDPVWADGGLEIIMPASGPCFNVSLVAHELGHSFGLAHDFRDDAHIMSYGAIQNELSSCAAEWLDASPFFNTDQNPSNMPFQVDKDVTIKMLPPIEAPPNGVRLRFEINDSDGLHQAQLYIPTTDRDPVEGSGFKLHSCRSLSGEVSTLEFITTELPKEDAFARLRVMDVRGNFKWWDHYFPIQTTDILPKSANRIGAVDTAGMIPATLQKVSGDDQRGDPDKRLAHPFVVAVRDADNEPVAGVQVTFRITVGDGSLSVANPWTDSNGHAQTFLTLDDSLINRVEASLSGISDKVIFDTGSQPVEASLDKITGPWLWMIAPTEVGQGGANSINVDSLAIASGGNVTEADVAANGATEGDSVGNLVWTLGEISPTGSNNVHNMLNNIGLGRRNVDDHSSYALITLESATAQSDVTMRAGSNDAIKIWLNGEVVHNNPIDRESDDFQDEFKVHVKKGDNLLFVKVSKRAGDWSMFVGIDEGVNAVYKRPLNAVETIDVADINADGTVNKTDLLLLVAALGENPSPNSRTDVNGDGAVNVADLLLVIENLNDPVNAAAPSSKNTTTSLDAAMLARYLNTLHAESDGSRKYQQAIAFLQSLLAVTLPGKTQLLANYPNPFNPETWIPYQLSEPAEVTLTIYTVNGNVVRKLILGHQLAGIYHSKSLAAYWDGRNEQGERVASGVYLYTLSAGDFTSTRKMLIRK